MEAMARMLVMVTKGLVQGGRAQPIIRTQILQCFRCQGWGHMARECPITSLSFKTALVEPREYAASPPPVTATPANGRPLTFPPQSMDWGQASMKVAQQTGLQEATPVIPFLNPDPITHLVGWSSEAPSNCRWAEGDCINQFGGTGFQCELLVLSMNDPEGSPSGQVVRTWGSWRLCHPIPGICGSESYRFRV